MIAVFEGLTGAGKTLVMTLMLADDWESGEKLHLNYRVYFSPDQKDVFRWHNLDELYGLTNGVIGIDEGQKLFDARRWKSLPMSFAEKIASHRHQGLDIYTTTQDLSHIDVRIRSNIHVLYTCKKIFRYPVNERIRPIIFITRVTKKIRNINTDTNRVTFTRVGSKTYYISRYWTKVLYDTYANIDLTQFICKIKREKGRWQGKIYSRELINRGKARI